MNKLMTGSIAILLSLVPAVSLWAHHSIANHDQNAVRLKADATYDGPAEAGRYFEWPSR